MTYILKVHNILPFKYLSRSPFPYHLSANTCYSPYSVITAAPVPHNHSLTIIINMANHLTPKLSIEFSV